MAVNIGPRIGIDGEAEYRKQIQRIIQETKTLKSEYEKVSSAMEKGKTTLKGNAEQHRILAEQIKKQEEVVKQNARMLDEARAKYDRLDAELQIIEATFGENSDEVKALTAEQEKAATACLKWEENTNKATTALNNMKAELDGLPSNIELVGQKMEAAGQKITSAGQGITSFGNSLRPMSTAAAGIIGGSVKVFMDFEHQMSRVKAISGATGEEFDLLNEKAQEMGSSTKFTATEAAQAFEYMGMAGWKAEDMLDGIAPIMELAAASGEDLAGVSDIVTDALTAFGLEAKDAAHFADVLAAASVNSNTNVSMLGESFKYAAPLAGSLGYSIDDTAIALGMMANNGIKADMAGTTLRSLLTRMAKPTKESQAAMDRLGISLSDDTGRMYSLAEILDQLRGSFGEINMPVEEFNSQVAELDRQLEAGELSESKYSKALEELIMQVYGAEGAEKARAAAMLAGQRGMSGLLAIVNTSTEDYGKLTDAIYNSEGAAHSMAETMEADTAGSWTQAMSAVEGAGIKLGKVFAPYVTEAANKVKELANAFSELDPQTQEMIAKGLALAAVAAPLVIGVGNVTSAFGGMVSGGGKALQLIGSLSGGMSGAATAAGSLGSGAGAASAGIAGIAAPAAIAVAAVGLLTGAFITAYNNDEAFAAKVNEDWAKIQASITDVINTIKPEWEAFSKFFSPVFTEAMESIDRRLQQFKTNFEGWADIIHGILEGDWSRAWDGAKKVVLSTNDAMTEDTRTEARTMEGIFRNMNIKLPHIKLPHFKVTGTNSWGLPSFDIDWYAKAMDSGMRLTSPTVFGASNGTLMAGGEAGNEWVIGETSILGMIRSAVRSSVGYIPDTGNTVNIGDTQIVINAAPGQDVEEIADAVDEIINMRYQQARQAWA